MWEAQNWQSLPVATDGDPTSKRMYKVAFLFLETLAFGTTVNSRYKNQLGGLILILIASMIPKARVPKGAMK